MNSAATANKPVGQKINNHPRVQKGAFVELTTDNDKVIIPFQFTPETITRTKRVKDNPKSKKASKSRKARKEILVSGEATKDLVSEWENFNLTLRLDAQDAIALGDKRAEEVGISHVLAMFEKLITPQPGGLLKDRKKQPKSNKGHSYSGQYSIPVVLFIWGKQRTIPVHLTSLQIEEIKHMPSLYPSRAVLTVGLKVIEGPVANPAYLYTYNENKERDKKADDCDKNAAALGANSVPRK